LNVEVALIEEYMSYAKADYARWWGPRAENENVAEMIREFKMNYEVGSSYIKIIQSSASGQSSVHSFIVNKAGKFAIGDVLKSASWKTPATNFKRATVADKNSWVGRLTWTGIN